MAHRNSYTLLHTCFSAGARAIVKRYCWAIQHMATRREHAFELFPGEQDLVRALAQRNEDFSELCEHYCLMVEAAASDAAPSMKTEYERLRYELENELRDFLRRHRPSK